MAPPNSPELPALPTPIQPGYATGSIERNCPLPTRISPRKRQRQPTIGEGSSQTRRSKAPPLKKSGAFIFAEPNPLYTRHVIEDPTKYHKMLIRCTQSGCGFTKEIKRAIASTGNELPHYRQYHKDIPLNPSEAARATSDRIEASTKPFFPVQQPKVSHDEKVRKLVLNLILKNNLSFSLVDQVEFNALVNFLSPTTAKISRRTLMRLLKKEYKEAEDGKIVQLQAHMRDGGRFSLTTDGWSGANRLDYVAVTVHYRTKDGILHNMVLSIVELPNPLHSGKYLSKRLFQITEHFGITEAVMTVTRDNASPNDTMLKDYERRVNEKYKTLSSGDQCCYCLKFNRTDGDVRCCAHIYNIAVNAGKNLSSCYEMQDTASMSRGMLFHCFWV